MEEESRDKEPLEVDARGVEKLKAYNAGTSVAFVQVAQTILQLDPSRTCPELQVLLKYLDAWISEINLKNSNLKDYEETLEQDSFKAFLQNLGASPEDCDIEVAPVIMNEIKRRCKLVVAEVLDQCSEIMENAAEVEAGADDEVDPDAYDEIDADGL